MHAHMRHPTSTPWQGRHGQERIMWRVAALVAVGLALAVSPPVQAKTFRCHAGDVACLIAAINDANAHGQQNIIRLEAGTYTLTAIDNTAEGPNGLPSITSVLTIRGAGEETTIIERESSAPPFRLVHVAATGSLRLARLTLRGGEQRFGGGIRNFGTLILRHSTLHGNTTGREAAGAGGGLYNGGTATLTHSTVRGNTVFGGFFPSFGGGIFNGGTLTLTHSTLHGNTGAGGQGVFGGGLRNNGTVTIIHSTISDNTARGEIIAGGGLDNGGTLTLTHSTVRGNTVAGPGFFGTSGGGGIRNAGTAALTDCSISGNTVSTTSEAGRGGGIWNLGTLTLLNCTLGGNTADNMGVGVSAGGGLANAGAGSTATLTNCTVSDNMAAAPLQRGAGGGLSNGGTLTVQNTILANNTVEQQGVGPDCRGVVTSLDHNLIGDPTGCTIVLQPQDLRGDPGLDAFTDNGRPGNGHFPLLATSQAIDAGNEAACPKRDQLGQRRVGPCDIGSIEFRDPDDRHHGEDQVADDQGPQ